MKDLPAGCKYSAIAFAKAWQIATDDAICIQRLLLRSTQVVMQR
jgi:hypothetical protein